MLLKVALLLGVEVHVHVEFVKLLEPPEDQLTHRENTFQMFETNWEHLGGARDQPQIQLFSGGVWCLHFPPNWFIQSVSFSSGTFHSFFCIHLS